MTCTTRYQATLQQLLMCSWLIWKLHAFILLRDLRWNLPGVLTAASRPESKSENSNKVSKHCLAKSSLRPTLPLQSSFNVIEEWIDPLFNSTTTGIEHKKMNSLLICDCKIWSHLHEKVCPLLSQNGFWLAYEILQHTVEYWFSRIIGHHKVFY